MILIVKKILALSVDIFVFDHTVNPRYFRVFKVSWTGRNFEYNVDRYAEQPKSRNYSPKSYGTSDPPHTLML